MSRGGSPRSRPRNPGGLRAPSRPPQPPSLPPGFGKSSSGCAVLILGALGSLGLAAAGLIEIGRGWMS